MTWPASGDSVEQVLSAWLERDLGAAADAGKLSEAHEIDDVLARLDDVVAGGMHPILVGERGVGKTAALQELVRRARSGAGPAALRDRRVVQLSFRRRISMLRQDERLGEAMQRLVEVLIQARGEIVPVFGDLHLARDFYLGSQFAVLAQRLGAPVLGEGETSAVDSMLEDEPELQHWYVTLPMEEPDVGTTARILRQWREQQLGCASRLEDEALEAALALTHRFLPRGRQPRKSIELLLQVRALAGKRSSVGADDVIERFQNAFRVPRFLIDPRAPFDLDAVLQAFRHRLLGQGQAVQTMVRTIATIKAGLSHPRRPFGVFLFVGPTGVGKTHLAQILAEQLFGSRGRLVRFNMADFQSPADAFTLFGNPDGHDPRSRRGLLTARLLGHPFAVVLFDEFEKAASPVHDRFFQLVDEGEFINGAGETISGRSLIFIATSNAGAEIYHSRAIGFALPPDLPELERELERRLQQIFRPEFLNRFDQIVHFHPLTRSDIRTIAQREIEQLGDRSGVRSSKLRLEIDEGLLDWLAAYGYDPLHGARFLRRTIERHVTTALAEAIARGDVNPGSKVGLRVRAGRVVTSVLEAARSEAEQPLAVTMPQGRSDRVQLLDRGALRDEAKTLLDRAAPLLAELERRREEASKLLEQVSAESLWQDPERAQELFARYRDMDLVVQASARHAEPLLWLEELRQRAATDQHHMVELGRAVERAARALRDWEESVAEEGPGSLWLLLRDTDPMRGGARWLEELGAMELAWCERSGLHATPVACGSTDEALSRLVLEVEGPGAMSILGMEHGLHRLPRPDKPDLRVRIDVVPKGPKPPARQSAPLARASTGPLGLVIRCRGRAADEERGLVVELGAASPEVLAHLLADLGPVLAPQNELPVARLYGEGGTGARDPRTGALVARYRDVRKGKLDPLLEAWRSARPVAPSPNLTATTSEG